LSKKGYWKKACSKGKFLFPVKAMSQVFRARYLEQLRQRCKPGQPLLNALYKKNWVVYAKRPFAHAMHVVEYLGRYTHKVAISNHRITAVDEHSVSFSYKDYRHGAAQGELKLSHGEFNPLECFLRGKSGASLCIFCREASCAYGTTAY
jgi:hypothetical protein